jgi:hypothetical protein
MTGRTLLVMALLLCAAGCSDEASDNRCEDEDPPKLAGLSDDIYKAARASLEQTTKVAEDGSKSETTSVSVSLTDYTAFEIVSRPLVPVGGFVSCFQLTGSPQEKCRGNPGGQCGSTTCGPQQVCINGACEDCVRQKLDADKVSITGLAAGSIDLERKSEGSFRKTPPPAAPLYGDGTIAVSLTGRSEAGFFPSTDLQIEPPTKMELTSPQPNSRAGGSDLSLEWVAGNGERIEITLLSTDTSQTDKVICLAADDGCATIPAGALDFIKANMTVADKIRVIVKREKSAVKNVAANTGMQIKATTRIDFLLEQ